MERKTTMPIVTRTAQRRVEQRLVGSSPVESSATAALRPVDARRVLAVHREGALLLTDAALPFTRARFPDAAALQAHLLAVVADLAGPRVQLGGGAGTPRDAASDGRRAVRWETTRHGPARSPERPGGVSPEGGC